MVGNSSLGIGLTIFLRNQFSGPSAQIRNSAKATTQELMRMQEQQLRQQRNLYAGLAMAGGLALRRMGSVVSSAAKFGYEMEFVKQISKSTNLQMANMSDQAMNLGQKTIFFAQDVAEGMRFMSMAGMDFQQVSGNIAAAVNLAAASGLSIAGRGGAADVMTNIMKAFKKEASESSYVSDILAEAATSANLNVFELGEALKYTGSTAMNLKVPLEDATAMAMTLANAGMLGSMAGVAMENSFRYLARAIGPFASGNMKKSLQMLSLTGEDFQDAAGNMLPMIQVFDLLRQRTRGMGTVKLQNVLTPLFGVRGQRAAGLIIRNYDEFVGHMGRFQNAHGRSAEISSGMMDTLQGSILRLQAVWKHMGIIFTKGIQPVLRPMLFVLEKIVNVTQKLFNVPILGNFLSTGLAGFILIKTAAFGFKAVVKGIQLVTLQTAATTGLFQSKSVAGWNSMTLAATRYNSAVMAANVQGGMASRAGLTTMAAAGGIKGLRVNKAGRLISSKTGGFISTAAAGGLAAGTARMVGGKVVAKSATRFLLGRVVGILGGPLGMALSFVLPAAIGALTGAINKNKEATETGNQIMKDNRVRMNTSGGTSRMGHIIEFQDINAPTMKVVGETGINKVSTDIDRGQLKRLADTLEKMLNNPQAQPIVINIDNEESLNTLIERKQGDALQMFQ